MNFVMHLKTCDLTVGISQHCLLAIFEQRAGSSPPGPPGVPGIDGIDVS